MKCPLFTVCTLPCDLSLNQFIMLQSPSNSSRSELLCSLELHVLWCYLLHFYNIQPLGITHPAGWCTSSGEGWGTQCKVTHNISCWTGPVALCTEQGHSPVFDRWLLKPEEKDMRRHWKNKQLHKTPSPILHVKEEVYVLEKLWTQKLVADNSLTQKFRLCRIIYHLWLWLAVRKVQSV